MLRAALGFRRLSMPAKKAKTSPAGGSNVSPFGTTSSGAPVQLITLRLGEMVAKVSTYGATLTSVVVPDCRGAPTETILGFEGHGGYEACPFYFGSTVGRFANRIGKGIFPLDGKTVTLSTRNDRGNTLHGGKAGWDKAVWTVAELSSAAVTLSHVSPDGDEGFPATAHVSVTYALEWGGRLAIRYRATVDAPTVLSMTNHAYFNLCDGGHTDVLDHELRVFADTYLPTDANCLPTGELKPVTGAMDLRAVGGVPLHRGVGGADGGGGYDHNYVVSEGAEADAQRLRRAAWLRSYRSGIELSVFTTEPGNAPGGERGARRGACHGPSVRTPRPVPSSPIATLTSCVRLSFSSCWPSLHRLALPPRRRHPDLLGRLSRRQAHRPRRPRVRSARGAVPRDAEVSGRAKPPGLALGHRAAGGAVLLHHHLRVRGERQLDQPRLSYSRSSGEPRGARQSGSVTD
jgi:aldose 1-epimerase